ncbi:MAG: homocysteine S-methyltransferase family protein [Deltaproteobacteria bacterium]|nr:homocysteine S-methyltransferase family protein [Deltaproteobacteria bacterium]MBN2671664.1 homocysteine S-methyltransferase family protein [Deltaproteobacteria bacterium]
MTPPNRFISLLRQAARTRRPLLLDGAIGTMLDSEGLVTEDAPWSGLVPLQHSDELTRLHRRYIQAGAQVITTCTFRTSLFMFEKYSLPQGLWLESAVAAVQAAKQAITSQQVAVAGSVGPLEDCFSPQSSLDAQDAYQFHLPLLRLLAEEGVDVLWLETFGHSLEIEGALRAAEQVAAETEIPFACSVTTRRNGCLLDGTALEQTLERAVSVGCSAFLVNCIPPNHVSAALSRLQHAGIPIGVYANLGVPEPTQDWEGDAFLPSRSYAETVEQWFSQNIELIGACCGSTPGHIAALAEMIRRTS